MSKHTTIIINNFNESLKPDKASQLRFEHNEFFGKRNQSILLIRHDEKFGSIDNTYTMCVECGPWTLFRWPMNLITFKCWIQEFKKGIKKISNELNDLRSINKRINDSEWKRKRKLYLGSDMQWIIICTGDMPLLFIFSLAVYCFNLVTYAFTHPIWNYYNSTIGFIAL